METLRKYGFVTWSEALDYPPFEVFKGAVILQTLIIPAIRDLVYFDWVWFYYGPVGDFLYYISNGAILL